MSAQEVDPWFLFRTLLKVYGKQNWWPAQTPFEVCVGAVLTQNTSWKNVESAIENLKKLNLLSPKAIIDVPIDKLRSAIKPAGFFNQKAVYLKNLSRFITENGGFKKLSKYSTRDLRKKLLSVKGIGRETADSILLYAFGKPSFVVDAYTKRLFSRLGFIEDSSYESVKLLVENSIKPTDKNVYIYNELHALIVKHCKEHCRKKPICKDCPLRLNCQFFNKLIAALRND